MPYENIEINIRVKCAFLYRPLLNRSSFKVFLDLKRRVYVCVYQVSLVSRDTIDRVCMCSRTYRQFLRDVFRINSRLTFTS